MKNLEQWKLAKKIQNSLIGNGANVVNREWAFVIKDAIENFGEEIMKQVNCHLCGDNGSFMSFSSTGAWVKVFCPSCEKGKEKREAAQQKLERTEKDSAAQ